MLPKKLQKKLDDRAKNDSLRSLPGPSDLIDFSSNDYLGFATSTSLSTPSTTNAETTVQSILKEHTITAHGATGSRLLSGNHALYGVAEEMVSRFHESESALIFNSGYDANIGLFQCVPQRGDLIIYDEYIHASIRDGIQMSLARGYKFKHNDLADLEELMTRLREMHHLDDQPGEHCIYVVTESVFSMDGDAPDLTAIAEICKKHNAYLIVDEAHAIGVVGRKGEGLVQSLGLQDAVFARIVTFGKALGSHGAAILSSVALRDYLVNYARSLIYTTGLSPHTVALTIAGYTQLTAGTEKEKQHCAIEKLQSLIAYFNEQLVILQLDSLFIESHSAIHCAVISGNERVKKIAVAIQSKGYDVRPILSPTVPVGQERLRICLHTQNTHDHIDGLLAVLKGALVLKK